MVGSLEVVESPAGQRIVDDRVVFRFGDVGFTEERVSSACLLVRIGEHSESAELVRERVVGDEGKRHRQHFTCNRGEC